MNENKKITINNLLVDLIIKSSRVQTLLNMLIDLNNGPMDFEMDISNDDYVKLQDSLKSCVDLLGSIVVKESDKLKDGKID